MKKVLYIVSTLSRSGPTNQLYNIIKYLDKNEFDPYLVTLSPEPENSRWADYEALGVHLYSLGLSRLRGLFCAEKQVQSLLAEIKPDVIHTQGIRGDTISSNLRTDVPKLATVRNLPQFDYIMTYGHIRGRLMCVRHINVLRKISSCIGVSDAVTNNLKNRYNVGNVLTIRNGVDPDIYFPTNDDEKKNLRKKLNLPLNGDIFISSGDLSERKDPLFLIEIWNKKFDSHDDKHLIFIGTGNLHDKCIQESQNCKSIHIVGQVNNAADYLKCSDYFISVSHAEGLPNAVLEAMACGLPVLLSDIEPHKEIFARAPDAGFCYELGNKVNFFNMLNKIITTDKTGMSRASLEAVNNHFSAKRMSEEYQRKYCDLCALTMKAA
jgi:glycosyltransferase involved in cell wall biosynthesis